MKAIFTLVFLFSLYTSQATNYYFSATSGDDSRTSVQAHSASTPWKTLEKLNSFFSSLQPGDSVLLKRGETFYGSITVNKSGTTTLPIVIGAYGTGNKPVITSLVTLNNWVAKGNGIWESYNSSLSTTISNVLVDGAAQEMGRYPNSDVANKGYLTLDAATSNSITDNELTSSVNWTGAEVVIRQRRWVTDRCLITNHSGTTINYTPVSSYTSKKNYGYFIQNDIKTLDKFGEWYYDPTSKKLSIYSGSNNPSSYNIEASTIDNLISSQKYNNISFSNLSIRGANGSGIYVKYASNVQVTNCDIMYSGVSGIYGYFDTNFKIENCTISNSNKLGIDLGYSGDYAIIRNNKITNTSVFPGLGGNGDGKGLGIQSYGNGSLIEFNEIINTGYVALNFNGDNTIVKNNFINGFCLTKDDGSGIYTFTGSSNINHTGRKVIGNIVINGIGAPEGNDENKPLVEGIYMDDNSSGVEISGNTVANTPGKGVFLHNARNITITDNTVYNNNVQLSVLHDTKGDAVRNNTITNNNFFSKISSQDVANFSSISDDNNLIGRLDSNYYARPIDDRIIINNSYVNTLGTRVNQDLDLEEWQDKYYTDATSKRTAKQISTYKLNSIIGSNKFPNGIFSSSKNGIFTTSCTASLSSAGQLEGSYLEVTPSAKYSSVFVDIGELKAGKKYVVRYSVKASGTSMYITTALRMKGSPYTVLTPLQYRKATLLRNENEMVFLSPTTETSAQIVFKANGDSKYYIDNIEVYEADATITNIDDSIRLEYNATSVSKTITLDGHYIDAKNNKFSNSIVLQPFTSAVLVKDDASNIKPSVSITSPVSNASFESTSLTISADATDADGTISKVDFYNRDTIIGTVSVSPYTLKLNNIAPGDYSISAKATDNSSLVTASAAVTVTVIRPNIAPSVSLTSPVSGVTFGLPASITISATATDTDGTISKVDFYSADTIIATVTASPYTFTWNNVTTGNYTITAKATDNSSVVTTSAPVVVSVSAPVVLVSNPNIAPSVTLTSPVTTTKYTGPAKISMSAAAKDADGTISHVKFYLGTTYLKTVFTSPYTYSISNVAPGTYTITAKATDNNGLQTISAPVTIVVAAQVLSLKPTGNHTTAGISNNVYAVDINGKTAVNQEITIQDIKVFPNPAVSKIQISTDGFFQRDQEGIIKIQGLTGIVFKTIPVTVTGKIIEADVSSLRPGVYIVSLNSNKRLISKTFIKN